MQQMLNMTWIQTLFVRSILLCHLWLMTNTHRASITPKRLYGEVGYNLRVTCTLEKEVLDAGLTSADISFYMYKKGQSTYFPQDYIHRPNATTAVLLLPSVTIEQDQSHLRCYQPSSNERLRTSYLHIGRKPEPSIIASVVANNWDTVTIKWTKADNPTFTTETVAYWKAQKGKSFQICHIKTSDGIQYSCSFSLSHKDFANSTYFNIKIVSSNVVGNVSSRPDTNTFYIADINKPRSVGHLGIRRKGATWIEVEWMSGAPVGQNLSYTISTSCRYPQNIQVSPTSERKIVRNLTDLHPGTICQLSVTGCTEHGKVCSDPRVLIETTDDSVPTVFPMTTLGGFQIHKTDAERTLTFYWQPIQREDQCGNITHYKITLRSKHSSVTKTEIYEVSSKQCCEYTMDLELDETYNISVAARTSVGYNTTLRKTRPVVVLPQPLLDSEAPRNVTAMSNGTNIIIVSWSSKVDGTNMGYWCQRGPTHAGPFCDGFVTWVKDIHNPWILKSLPVSTDLQRLRFGVSSDLDTSSSGILWSDFVYDLTKKARPPVVDAIPTDTGLTLYLKYYAIYSDCPGYIYAYLVEICRLLDTQCIERKTVTVSRTGKKTVWIDDSLKSNAMYQVTVHSITVAGLSNRQTVETVNTRTGVKMIINHNWTGIVVGCVFATIFFLLGCICIFIKCRNTCMSYMKKVQINFRLPEQPQSEDIYPVQYENVTSDNRGISTMPYGIYTHKTALPPLPYQKMQLPGPTIANVKLTDEYTDSGIDFHNDSDGTNMSGGDHLRIVVEVDEISKQNKLNTELDNDYNYSSCGVASDKKNMLGAEQTQDRNKRSSEDSWSASSGDVYKETGVLLDLNRHKLPADSCELEQPSANDSEDSSDGYTQTLFIEVGWRPLGDQSIPDDSTDTNLHMEHLGPQAIEKWTITLPLLSPSSEVAMHGTQIAQRTFAEMENELSNDNDDSDGYTMCTIKL